MSDEDKIEQTAVAEDTNTDPKEGAVAEGGAAQKDDLDDLLKEFDERQEASAGTREGDPKVGKSETKEPASVDLEALAALERRLNEQESREQRRELEKLFDRLADGTMGDSLDAEAYLNAVALRNPKLNQAWQHRQSNPKAWDRVYGELKKDFTDRRGRKVDKQATESKEAVASAIRSASTAAPQKDYSDKEIASMPKDEFDALQRKLGISPV